MAAHVYKFNKGGLLTMKQKLKKMLISTEKSDGPESVKWSEEIRNIDDLKWDIQVIFSCPH